MENLKADFVRLLKLILENLRKPDALSYPWAFQLGITGKESNTEQPRERLVKHMNGFFRKMRPSDPPRIIKRLDYMLGSLWNTRDKLFSPPFIVPANPIQLVRRLA